MYCPSRPPHSTKGLERENIPQYLLFLLGAHFKNQLMRFFLLLQICMDLEKVSKETGLVKLTLNRATYSNIISILISKVSTV